MILPISEMTTQLHQLRYSTTEIIKTIHWKSYKTSTFQHFEIKHRTYRKEVHELRAINKVRILIAR